MPGHAPMGVRDPAVSRTPSPDLIALAHRAGKVEAFNEAMKIVGEFQLRRKSLGDDNSAFHAVEIADAIFARICKDAQIDNHMAGLIERGDRVA